MRIFLLPLILMAVSAPDIERTIVEHLNRHFPLAESEYLCDFSRLNIPEANQFDSVAVDGYGKDIPKGNTVVRYSLFKDGVREKMCAGTVKIGIIKEVLVTTTPVKTGERITSDMFVKRPMDIAAADDNVFDSIESLGEVVAVRYIPPGRIITGSLVSEPPVVVPGDIVDIKYESGSLSLTARGIVKKAGAQNSEVRVLNIDTKRIISARVIDSTTVALSPKEEN